MTRVDTELEAVQRDLRIAARALARAGLVTAYGHCSVRLDADRFLVCAAKPMGLIAPGEPGVVAPIRGVLPEGVLGEVRIHQQVYLRRREVGAVCRIFPPMVVALSALGITPEPRSAAAIPFAPRPPFWDDSRLLRDDGLAEQLAERLGEAAALVMKANGAVVVGRNLPQAVMLAAGLEEAARIEHIVRLHRPAAPLPVLPESEIEARKAAVAGAPDLRMWRFMTHGDPEL